MSNYKLKMDQSLQALRGAAKSIPAAMEEDAIKPDEVHAILVTIADQIEMASNEKMYLTE